MFGTNICKPRVQMRGRSQISKELVTSAARVTIALRVER